MKLAQEIFKIMDGPGMVSEILVKTYHNHPGTNNFGTRLNEAKRIHYENRFMASRLDNVQPYYQFTKLQGSPKKKHIKLKQPSQSSKRKNQYSSSAKSTGSSSPSSPRSIRTAPQPNRRHQYTNERKQMSSAGGGQRDPASKPKNLIMEHWKIQNGRVLDVAVLKEPFEDRFSLLGIDVDDGQRYQLSLSSEEVSNILEGDMLVTSFDNPNVWLALIDKVSLRPVLAFVKPGSAPVAVSASISIISDTKPSAVSGVSSVTEMQGSFDIRQQSITTQEVNTSNFLTEDWGSLNMPAIDVPISNYGADPDYDDAFEEVDDPVMKKSDEMPSVGVLPSINNISVPGSDDLTGLEAAPPPFELPLTRPSRPVTAINRGSSTSVGPEVSERGLRDSRAGAEGVAITAEKAQLNSETHEDDTGVHTFSVSTTGNSVVSKGTDVSVEMSEGDDDKTKPRPTPPPGSKPTSNRISMRNNALSPRAVKNEKKYPAPVENVPWNSNVLVTKVHERMAEISAHQQEVEVKRRATEYKQKKSEGRPSPSKQDNENIDEDNSSPQKVSFKPEPPSGPKPSLHGEVSYKSSRGRRPTSFPTAEHVPADDEDHTENILETDNN